METETLARRGFGRDGFKFVAIGGAEALLVVFVLGYLVTCRLPYDQSGYLVGRDFVNCWMGARAVLAGRAESLFHLTGYNREIAALFGPLPPLNWSYPPVLLLGV